MEFDTPEFRLAYSRAPGFVGKEKDYVDKSIDRIIVILWKDFLKLKEDPNYFIDLRKRGGIFEKMLEPELEVERILCLGHVKSCSNCTRCLSTDGWVITDKGLGVASKPTKIKEDWRTYSYNPEEFHVDVMTGYTSLSRYVSIVSGPDTSVYCKCVTPITKKLWTEVFEQTQKIAANYFDARQEQRYQRWSYRLKEAENTEEYRYEKKGKNKKEHVAKIRGKMPIRYYLEVYQEKITNLKNKITEGMDEKDKIVACKGIDYLIKRWEEFLLDIHNWYHLEKPQTGYLKDPRERGLILY